MTSDGKLTLMAVGDIHIKRPDPLSIFGDTAEVLARADVLLGNQEGPVSDRGEPLLAKRSVGSVCLRAPVGSIAAEAEIGFSAMTLANNHTMDYGPEALLQTRDLLHAHGIATAGAGADAKEAHTPAIIECNGVRIAMLGYTSVFPVSGFAAGDGQPGVATVRVSTSYQAPPSVPYQPGTPAVTLTVPQGDDMRQMADDIAGAADDADLVVVQFHWGVAGYAHPIGYMKEMARFAVDAGADLILGNHAHVLQGLEVYRDALICYSLNHFAFETNPGRTVAATTYLPRDGHPDFLPDLSLDAQLAIIRQASGVSGSNIDYVRHAARALRDLGIDEPAIFAVEAALKQRAQILSTMSRRS